MPHPRGLLHLKPQPQTLQTLFRPAQRPRFRPPRASFFSHCFQPEKCLNAGFERGSTVVEEFVKFFTNSFNCTALGNTVNVECWAGGWNWLPPLSKPQFGNVPTRAAPHWQPTA